MKKMNNLVLTALAAKYLYLNFIINFKPITYVVFI